MHVPLSELGWEAGLTPMQKTATSLRGGGRGMHRVSGVDGVRTCDARNAADALEGATRTTAGVLSMEPWLPEALPNLMVEAISPWEALFCP